MNVNTSIYGYVTDGAAYHPGCEPDELDASTNPAVKALFNWDLSEFSPEGLTCDGCTEWIVEPDEQAEEATEPEPVVREIDPLLLARAFGYDQLTIDFTTAPGSQERRESARAAFASARSAK